MTQFKSFHWLSHHGLYKQWSPFGAGMCSDVCPRTLSVLRGGQFSESQALGKLFASRSRWCPRTDIRACFRAKWRLLFVYFRVKWRLLFIYMYIPCSTNVVSVPMIFGGVFLIFFLVQFSICNTTKAKRAL